MGRGTTVQGQEGGDVSARAVPPRSRLLLPPSAQLPSCPPGIACRAVLRSGWYRGLRGLCGAVGYTAQRMRWTPHAHAQMPPCMRAGVRAMLLCHKRTGCALGILPLPLLHQARRLPAP